MPNMTVQELLETPLPSATIVVSEDNVVTGQGAISNIEPLDGGLRITFNYNGSGLLYVDYLASDCSINGLEGGNEILIQEGDSRATIYPAA